MSMKIVYVTGCLGFIGSYVAKACLEEGWQVMGIDSMTYASHPNRILPELQDYDNFTFKKEDICDLDWLYDCDFVINCAAETHVDNSIVNSSKFLQSNVSGVHNLLKLVKSKGNYQMPTFLHFSTDEVYGDIADGTHKETDILTPSNPYSATKAAADQLITAWGRTYGLPYIIVRPTNNYGIYQHTEKLIPKACKFITTGRKIPLHEKGTPIRNWLHAADTADAIITLVKGGSIQEIYNISGNFEQSNLETVKKILREFHDDYRDEDLWRYINYEYSRTGQDVRYSVDDSKLKELGWSPNRKFDDEIGRIVEFYKDNFIW